MKILSQYSICIAISTLLLTNLSCSKEQINKNNTTSISLPNSIKITNLSIPEKIQLSRLTDIQISGQGFLKTDTIVFSGKNNKIDKVELPIAKLNESYIALNYSDLLNENTYLIYIIRDGYYQQLGQTSFTRVFNPNIPDIANMTIKGVVHSQGKGIPNVVVSDGEEFAKTDENGIYYLPSAKKNGHVFISVPSNYEVKIENSIPQFYKNLTSNSSQTEIKDFELFPVNNENHIVAFLADSHLANRNDDLKQFKEGFLQDVNDTYQSYKAQNKKFYAFTLGDQSWDAYWYDNNFKLKEYLNQIKDIEFPVYNTIGNHDYDPYIGANDWLAEANYRNIMGPTYYSINIGKVHYIVLDNVVYTNNGASPGIMGDRDYNNLVTANQIDWLKKDLAYITDKNTPIVLAMHVPLYVNPTSSGSYYTQNGQQVIDALAGFKNVKVMSGHTHINYRVSKQEAISEFNIGAISATWWWTGRAGYANNHICRDGSPGGYGIWEIEGTNQKMYYKGIGLSRDYQFRAYDLNTVQITADTYTPNANATFKAKVPSYAGEYANKNSTNQVLLNVWGYNPKWKIVVTENGKVLPIQQTTKKDPLHIISYSMQRLNVNTDPTASFVTNTTNHLFLTTASSPTTTLEITVEDDYGNKYKEVMVRPKAFSTSIK